MQRLFEQSEHLFWEIRGTGLTTYVGTCKGYLSNQDISSEKPEALDSHAMLEHANVVWAIRTSFLRNQRHWTHKLCWNMQMLFEQSEHLFWEIRSTGLTNYVGTCKYCLSNQDISEKSEVLDSQAMLEHANIVWAIRTSFLRNQRCWTHMLCWNMQMLFEQSGHLFWETRGTELTFYVGTCKCCLSNQDIFSEKPEALDSHSMLEHANIVWAIRTSLLRNQRHWTHKLCWNMQILFEQSGRLFWEIRGTGLTNYVGTCKYCLSNQDIFSEKSEALDSHPMLEHAKFVEQSGHLFWEIRGTRLTSYVGTCKCCLSNQDIFSEKPEALDSHSMLEHANIVWAIRTSLLRNQRHWTHMLCWNMQMLFEQSGHLFWETRGTGLTYYVGTCKCCLSNQDIFSEKSEALDSQAMLEHTNVVWAIRTSLLRNQRHWTHMLCWNMQMLFEQSGHLFWEIRSTGLTSYVGTCKYCLSNQNISSEKSEALDSQAMLEHTNIVWAIRTSLSENTEALDELTGYIRRYKNCLSDIDQKCNFYSYNKMYLPIEYL